MTRLEARAQILKTVNRRRRRENAKRRTNFLLPMLYAGHIQQAVCIARRNRLVDNDVLAAAGYRTMRAAA